MEYSYNGIILEPGKWNEIIDSNGKKIEIYCPLEITEDTSVVFHHSGSSGIDGTYYGDYNQPDTIMVLYGNATGENAAQINGIMEDVVDQLYEGNYSYKKENVR